MAAGRRKLKVCEVVKTVELDEIALPDGDSYHFRVEVLRRGPRDYGARVWRLERYHVSPTFPVGGGRRYACDEKLLVADVIGSSVTRRTAREVIEGVLDEVEEMFEAVLNPSPSATPVVGERKPKHPAGRGRPRLNGR